MNANARDARAPSRDARMADDLRKKRDAYFDALARDDARRAKRARGGGAATRRRRDATDGDEAATATAPTDARAAPRRGVALRARGLALARAPRASTTATTTATTTTTTTRDDAAGRDGAGRATITGIPRAPPGDPCDLDLDAHDGRRFARARVPADAVAGEAFDAQIFPNGPVVRVTPPRGTKPGDEIEFAVAPWTVDDVPPKPPRGRGGDGEEEAPPPPPGEPPTGWTGRAPPPPPPASAAFGYAVIGGVDVPPPPPGSP